MPKRYISITLTNAELWATLGAIANVKGAGTSTPAEVLQASVARAKSNVGAYVREALGKYPHVFFVTYTFRENVQTLRYARSHMNDYQKEISSFAPCIGVWERQKRGAWHFHSLMFSHERINGRYLHGLWKHGYVTVDPVNDSSGAVAYICKYMSKTWEGLDGSRRYVAYGLPKPIRTVVPHEEVHRWLPPEGAELLDVKRGMYNTTYKFKI